MSARKLPPLKSQRLNGEAQSKESSDQVGTRKKIVITEDNNDTIDGSQGKPERRHRPRSKSPRKMARTASSATENEESLMVKGPPKRRAKTKKTGSSTEMLVDESGENEKSLTNETRAQPKKVRVKRKSKKIKSEDVDNMGLAGQLNGIQEDVILADETDATPVSTKLEVSNMKSRESNKVFIEQKGKFKSANKDKLTKLYSEEQRRYEARPTQHVVQNTLELALWTNKVLRTFCLFCHGLLAGFALWQIIMVYSLSGHDNGYEDFVKYYAPVAMPVQSLYYFLLVICTMSTFDRFDVGRPTRKFLARACSLQNGAISAIIYFITLVLSVAITNIDDKINLHHDKEPLWDLDSDRDAELDKWRILNLIRGVGSILGWLILSVTPNTDRLSQNLKRADPDFMGKIDKPSDTILETIRSSGV